MLAADLRNFTSELSVKPWDHFPSRAALCVQLHTHVHPPKVEPKGSISQPHALRIPADSRGATWPSS